MPKPKNVFKFQQGILKTSSGPSLKLLLMRAKHETLDIFTKIQIINVSTKNKASNTPKWHEHVASVVHVEGKFEHCDFVIIKTGMERAVMKQLYERNNKIKLGIMC